MGPRMTAIRKWTEEEDAQLRKLRAAAKPPSVQNLRKLRLPYARTNYGRRPASPAEDSEYYYLAEQALSNADRSNPLRTPDTL